MESLAEIPPFVSWAWCAENQGRIVLADCRWYLDGSTGRDAYGRGHLPGAAFVDLDRWLSGPASQGAGRNPLPEPEVFARGMREAGIDDDDVVVAYDDAGGVIAARMVWMLRTTGHRAAVLDGGMAAYPGPLDTEAPQRRRGGFTATAWPRSSLASLAQTVSGDHPVVDARNRDRYDGRQDPVDPRPGHIPGAANVPCRGHLDASGTLLPEPDLRANFARAGISTGKGTVNNCGSGVTACHNLLVLEHIGMGRGRLFVGGWSQYGHVLDLPVATGQP
ncbi:sulfurtransferase [Pseudarthrobacter sp. P1]|uniref:sulfurtransferase n=1 Tax=Pseudarthrobacter sp. P1 TaxID=3418418 RepID=UPI003CF4F24C